MAAQGPIVDPTKPAKYPIILSDALLGKTPKETYTGIRYNHKPALSSDAAPASARLKRSAKEGVFNLGFDDHALGQLAHRHLLRHGQGHHRQAPRA